MAVLVDTNVILDLVTDDPQWADWSEAKLQSLEDSPLLINPIIFSELCVGAESAQEVAALCDQLNLQILELSPHALFLAAKAFLKYRRSSGKKTSPLPDFYIGAQAQDADIPILTRDPTRYQSYFPGVALIAPS